MAFVYRTSDGAGDSGRDRPRHEAMDAKQRQSITDRVQRRRVQPWHRRISSINFFDQFGRDMSLVCETAANHDWKSTTNSASTGRIPSGYETFWRNAGPSNQPVDLAKRSGGRYDHVIDLGGWRLISSTVIGCAKCSRIKRWPGATRCTPDFERAPRCVKTRGRRRRLDALHAAVGRLRDVRRRFGARLQR
jgi:hypothetical protein